MENKENESEVTDNETVTNMENKENESEVTDNETVTNVENKENESDVTDNETVTNVENKENESEVIDNETVTNMENKEDELDIIDNEIVTNMENKENESHVRDMIILRCIVIISAIISIIISIAITNKIKEYYKKNSKEVKEKSNSYKQKKESNSNKKDKKEDNAPSFFIDLTGDSPTCTVFNLPPESPHQKFRIRFDESNGLSHDFQIEYGESLDKRYYEPYNVFGKFDGWYFEDGTKLEKDTKLWTGYNCTVKARWIWNPDYKSITVELGENLPIHALPNINIGHALYNPIYTGYTNLGTRHTNLVVSIVDIKQGPGSKLGWGLLYAYKEKRNGWISLDEIESIKSINLKKDNGMIIFGSGGLERYYFTANWKKSGLLYTIRLDEAKGELINKYYVFEYQLGLHYLNISYTPKHPFCVFDDWYFYNNNRFEEYICESGNLYFYNGDRFEKYTDLVVRAKWIWNPKYASITGWISDIVPIYSEPNSNSSHASDTGKKNLKVVIVDIQQGPGSKLGWGLLESYKEKRNGWVSLDFLKEQCKQEKVETGNKEESQATEQENAEKVDAENKEESQATEQENAEKVDAGNKEESQATEQENAEKVDAENKEESQTTEQENAEKVETGNKEESQATEQENAEKVDAGNKEESQATEQENAEKVETGNKEESQTTEQENAEKVETGNKEESQTKKYKIHFDAAKGGADDKDILVASGEMIGNAYYEPIHLFCKFDGWYFNNDTKLNRDTKIECDCTVKARWIWNPEYDCITVMIEKIVPIHAKPDINIESETTTYAYTVHQNIVVSIYDIKQGSGSKLGWGLLKAFKRFRNGWINMDDVTVLLAIRKKDNSWIKYGEKGLKIVSQKE